jgi:dimethylaniline monooxygenase (N-oxide forming)
MAAKQQRFPKVCVIGAGVAGLAAAKQLHQSGISFDCYDPRDRVGGIWAYTEQAGITSAWSSLNMNSPRGTYEFSDYPMPASYPDFPRHTQMWAYLNNYVDHFGFRRHIHLNTSVQHLDPQEDGSWLVTISTGQTVRYDAVVVANGHHNEPLLPAYTGQFAGREIHSRDYRHREPYQDKRVLVVGFGNSGSQIAVDVSHTAQDTFLSMRRGGWLVPHYHLGKPIHKWFSGRDSYLMEKYLPWPLSGMISTFFYRLLLGYPEKFGLPKPDHHFGAELLTISENLINRIGDGRIHIRPEVTGVDGHTVTFSDGSQETVDEIIYCTGYKLTFPFLNPAIFDAPDNHVRLYQRIFLPSRPTICFIGALQANAWGFLPIFEIQARLVARYFCGEYAPPSPEEMEREIERDAQLIAKQFVDSPRNHYMINGYVYMADLEQEIKRGAGRARKAGVAGWYGRASLQESASTA